MSCGVGKFVAVGDGSVFFSFKISLPGLSAPETTCIKLAHNSFLKDTDIFFIHKWLKLGWLYD